MIYKTGPIKQLANTDLWAPACCNLANLAHTWAFLLQQRHTAISAGALKRLADYASHEQRRELLANKLSDQSCCNLGLIKINLLLAGQEISLIVNINETSNGGPIYFIFDEEIYKTDLSKINTIGIPDINKPGDEDLTLKGSRQEDPLSLPWPTGPRIIQAQVIRSPSQEMIAAENEVFSMEKSIADGHWLGSKYKIGRGLLESSFITSHTRFGPIAKHLAWRLQQGPSPLKLLVIGPGQGNLERKLKSKFGDNLIIDAFGLSYEILRENAASLRRFHLGNIDYHALPNGYDIILSLFGTQWATDPIFILEQIFAALTLRGEACFSVPYLDNNHLGPLENYSNSSWNEKNVWALKEEGVFLATRVDENFKLAIHMEKHTDQTTQLIELIKKHSTHEQECKSFACWHLQNSRDREWTKQKSHLKEFIRTWLQTHDWPGSSGDKKTEEWLDFYIKCLETQLKMSYIPVEVALENDLETGSLASSYYDFVRNFNYTSYMDSD